MSKAPEGAGKAAQKAEASGGYTMKEYVDGFKTEVNKSIDEKKKDDKLSATVGELKKAGTEVVEGLLKDQAGQQLDPDKFLQAFWKAFDARLKQLPDVRKQLKSKGLPDLKVTMGGIVQMTIYEHVVLPRLAKKDKPPNDKLVATFAEKFDEKLDAIVKKKEFKMYKDAAAEVAGKLIENSFIATEESQKMEEELKELKKLKKQPRPTRNEKQLLDENAELKEKNQELKGQVNNLEGQVMKTNDPGAEATMWEHRYNDLQQSRRDDANMIGELEQTRDTLQEQLKETRDVVRKLTQQGGSAQGQMKELQTQLTEQKERVANGVVELNKATKETEELKAKLQESESQRSQTNEDYETLRIDFEKLKEEAKNSTPNSKHAEYEDTIKGLREQAEKDKEEIGKLEAAQAALLEKAEDDLSQADARAIEKAEKDVKNRLRLLSQDLANAQAQNSRHVQENTSLKEKNEQLETTHRAAEKKNADLTEKHAAELAQKNEEVGKAAGDGEAAAKKLADLAKQHEEASKAAADDAAAAAKKLADAEKERDQLKDACKDLQERENSLKTTTEEQQKQLDKSEADKAEAADTAEKNLQGLQKELDELRVANQNLEATQQEQQKLATEKAGDAGKVLQGVQKERDDLRVANQKLEAAQQEQQKLAAAKASDDEKTLKTLQDQYEKLQGDIETLTQARGNLDERVSSLQEENDEFTAENKNLKAELEKAKHDTTKEENQALQEQVQELLDLNKDLQDSISKVSQGGNGDGLETVAEVDENEVAGKTPEENAAMWRTHWAAAVAARNRMDKDLGDVRRNFQELQAAYERVEKGREDAQTGSRALEDRLETAEAARDAAEAARQTAEAARQAAQAAAAAAAAGNTAATGTPGSTRTMGEVTLQPRTGDAVPGATRDSLFAGLANIFGRGGQVPIGGGGGDPGRRPSAPRATDDSLERWFVAGFALMITAIILALIVMGAEGHKAAVWFAANHETRAQYANDWYYFTIPVPQLEYIFYVFTRAAWTKM